MSTGWRNSFRKAEPFDCLVVAGRLVSEALDIREREEDRGLTPGRGGKDGVVEL